MDGPVIITRPNGDNPPQWINITRANGKATVRANAFPDFLRSMGQELIRLAEEEDKRDDPS